MVLHILSPLGRSCWAARDNSKGAWQQPHRQRSRQFGGLGRDSQYLSDIHNPLSFSVALAPGDLLHPSSQASGRQRLGKEIFGGCSLIGPIRGSRASYQGTYHGTEPGDVDRVIMAPICRLCGSRGLSGYRGSRRPIRCPRRLMNRVFSYEIRGNGESDDGACEPWRDRKANASPAPHPAPADGRS